MGLLVALGVSQSPYTPGEITLFFAPGRAPLLGVVLFYVQSAWLSVTLLLSLIRAAWCRAIPRAVPPKPPPTATGTGTESDASCAPSLPAASPCYSPSDLLASSPLDRRMRHARHLPAPAGRARTNFGENEVRGRRPDAPESGGSGRWVIGQRLHGAPRNHFGRQVQRPVAFRAKGEIKSGRHLDRTKVGETRGARCAHGLIPRPPGRPLDWDTFSRCGGFFGRGLSGSHLVQVLAAPRLRWFRYL